MNEREELEALRRLAELEAKARGGIVAPKATLEQRTLASGPVRFLKGAKDPIDKGAQLLPRALAGIASVGGLLPNPVSNWLGSEAARVDADITASERQYQEARAATGQEGFDAFRFAGNVASPVNLGIARAIPVTAGMTVPQMAARGGAAGAIAGGMQQVTDPEQFGAETRTQILMGGLGGLVATPAFAKAAEYTAKGVANVLARFRKPDPARIEVALGEIEREVERQLRSDGMSLADLTAEMRQRLRAQAAESLATGRRPNAAVLLRQQDFRALGMEGMRGQVTRDPMQFARERNLRGIEGVGEPIQARISQQQTQLGERLSELGGARASLAADEAGDVMIEALRGVDAAQRNKVTALYRAARESAGKDLNVPLAGLASDYGRILERYGGKNVPGAIQRRMAELGVVGGRQRQVFTPEVAEDVLQQINKLYDPLKKGEANALDELRGAIKRAVTEAPAGDVFESARQAAASRFRLLDSAPALQAAADKTVAADDFVRRFIISGKRDEMNALAQALQDNPDALRAARGQIAGHLYKKAFGANAAGDKMFAAESFNEELQRIGRNRLLAFFTPDEVDQLYRIGRVGAFANQPPGPAAVNFSNTTSAAINALQRALNIPGVRFIPGVNEGLENMSRRVAVRAALSNEIPPIPTELPPEVMNALSAVLRPVPIAAGLAAIP